MQHFTDIKIGRVRGMDDHCFQKLKREIFPLIQGKKNLLILEGSNYGLIKPQAQEYQPLVQLIHPYLLRFCQKEKVDLLSCDNRFSFGIMKDYSFIEFIQRIEQLGLMLDITRNGTLRNLNDLEKMIKNNQLTWKFKEEATEEIRSFKKQIYDKHQSCDVHFLEKLDESEAEYDNTVLLVGLSHFVNLKLSCDASEYTFVNLVDLKKTPLDYTASAYATYYLI